MAEPFRNLAWDDFRLVKAIADAKGLPSAAQQLGINHSTVFRRLRQIEAALGTPLFERHRVGYVPTAAGEEMVSLAGRLEEDITAFTRKVSGREPSPAGELRVTTNDSLLVHLLTPLFALFLVQCPDMRLDVVLSNQPLNLSKRDADVAIRATDNPPETLVGRRAARIAWALYGRAADFPVPGAAADPDALHRRSWISLGEDMAAMKVVRRVRENVPPERIAYRTNSVLGLGEAVEAGIGIAYLPCLIADVRPALVRLAPPDPELSADLWLLTHPDLRHAPRVRVFLDFMAAEIAKRRRVIEGTDLPIGQIDR